MKKGNRTVVLSLLLSTAFVFAQEANKTVSSLTLPPNVPSSDKAKAY